MDSPAVRFNSPASSRPFRAQMEKTITALTSLCHFSAPLCLLEFLNAVDQKEMRTLLTQHLETSVRKAMSDFSIYTEKTDMPSRTALLQSSVL